MDGLERFMQLHERDYPCALREIRNGRKVSHWIWYIFPQMRGLGWSDNSHFYGIKDAAEARAYLAHPVLGKDLREITEVLLQLETDNPYAVFGSIDTKKLCSCMTLFYEVSGEKLFDKVLEKFFGGRRDRKTLELLRQE